jgi:hypothetical protein
MRRLFTAGLSAAALFALPVPALAAEDFGASDVLEGQLSVKGPDLFYARSRGTDRGGRKGFDVIRATAAASMRVGRTPGPGPGRYYFDTEFDASSTLYAAGVFVVHDDGEDFLDDGGWFRFAPLGEKLTTLTNCTGSEGPTPEVAVDGTVVAVAPSSCGFGADVTVVDTSPGAPVPQRTIPVPLERNTGELRLAGRYVAYIDRVDDSPTSPERFITVYDWVAGAEVYRARASSAVPIPGDFRIDFFDLQHDGTIVYASGRSKPPPSFNLKPPCVNRYGVAWASVAEPVAHLIPGLKACSPEMRIGAGRIAAFRRVGDRGNELVTTDLAVPTSGPWPRSATSGWCTRSTSTARGRVLP